MIDNFNRKLTVTQYSSGLWKVAIEFTYSFISKKGVMQKITVDKGFLTDFASVPRIFWSILPPTGKYTQAAVLHDFLYKNGWRLGYSRFRSDKIFLSAMKTQKVKKWKIYVMFFAVRIFARSAYKKY